MKFLKNHLTKLFLKLPVEKALTMIDHKRMIFALRSTKTTKGDYFDLKGERCCTGFGPRATSVSKTYQLNTYLKHA